MKMKIAPFLAAWIMGCAQFVRGGQQSGYVIEWGWNTSTGKAVLGKQVMSDVLAVSAGRVQCLALKNDGTVVQWGGNFRAEAAFEQSILTTGEGGVADKTGSHATHANTTYKLENGTVRIGGKILSDVVSIAAGDGFSLALMKGGTVASWGETVVLTPLSNITAIEARGFEGLAIRNDKTVIQWSNAKGSPDYGKLEEVPSLNNVVSVAIGGTSQGSRQLALKQDGTVVEWGGGAFFREKSGSNALNHIVSIASGDCHNLAVNRDGTVFGWGMNDVGQATGVPTTNAPYLASGRVVLRGETLSNVVSVAANNNYSLALKTDGTVVAWGKMVNNLYPATVPNELRGVMAIAAGDNFCLAITTNRVIADRFRQ